MAKTRLNQERRFALSQLARKFCSELQLDPAENQEVADSIKQRDAAFAKLSSAAFQQAAKFYPPADIDVLRRYNLTSKVRRVTFANLDDSSDVFEVRFVDKDAFMRDYDNMQRDERIQLQKDYEAEKQRVTLEVPQNSEGSISRRTPSYRYIPCDQVLSTLYRDWQAACENEKSARDMLYNKRRKLLNSIETLINQCRYYEDVIAVWPFAATLRDKIIPPQTALSVLSEDALTAIREAQSFHDQTVGTTPAITTIPRNKALPAPSGDIIDGEFSEAEAAE